MRKITISTLAAALVSGGIVIGMAGGTASAHHAEISTRCDSSTGETIVSLNIVYPSGSSATFGGESIPLNTPLGRRITEPTQLVLDGPGTAYDDVQTVVPVEGCETSLPVDPCSWPAVRNNDAVCVGYNVVVECGSISGSAAHSVSNQPSWVYGVWFSTDLPTGPDDGTPGGLSFPEDSGDANVFYWVAGTENDVVRGVPTWTNPAQQSIDTDCEQPTTTTTQPATTTEPPVVTTTPPTPTEPEPTTTVAPAPTTTVVDEDPPCEWEVPEDADYRDGFWYDGAGNVIGQAEFEDECVEFHAPVPANFVVAQAALPETK